MNRIYCNYNVTNSSQNSQPHIRTIKIEEYIWPYLPDITNNSTSVQTLTIIYSTLKIRNSKQTFNSNSLSYFIISTFRCIRKLIQRRG